MFPLLLDSLPWLLGFALAAALLSRNPQTIWVAAAIGADWYILTWLESHRSIRLDPLINAYVDMSAATVLGTEVLLSLWVSMSRDQARKLILPALIVGSYSIEMLCHAIYWHSDQGPLAQFLYFVRLLEVAWLQAAVTLVWGSYDVGRKAWASLVDLLSTLGAANRPANDSLRADDSRERFPVGDDGDRILQAALERLDGEEGC